MQALGKYDEIGKFWPKSVPMPAELRLLCDYALEHPDEAISGEFRLGGAREGQFRALVNGADQRLGQFGRGSTGSKYCVCLQVDGRTPIVHLGSEGDYLIVLGATFVDFLAELAVGYWELGHHVRIEENADGTPDLCGSEPNPTFSRWVEERFHIAIPKTAKKMQADAASPHDDFAAWLKQQVEY